MSIHHTATPLTSSHDNSVEILIVEDSQTQGERLCYVLSAHGFSPTLVGSSAEALTAIYHHRPTLVLSDIVMPEMDGYHLCARIKSDPTLDIGFALLCC